MQESMEISQPAYIYETLEQDILLFRLKPGEFISEHQLCERFKVSRTPIRGVLQRLAQADLVEIIPKKGTRVTQIDYRIVDQMVYQRKAVETMVLRDFIRVCSPSDVEIVRKSMDDLIRSYQTGIANGNFNPEDFQKKDMKMHEIWFAKMQRLYLWNMIRMTQSSYTRFCFLDMLECKNYQYVLEEHQQMLNIIEEKNEKAIEDIMTQHLYGGVKRLGSMIFNEFYDFFLPESIQI